MIREWQWRTDADLPPRLLVVATRTEYTPESWQQLNGLLPPAHARLLGACNMLGIAMYADDFTYSIWGVTAWRDYHALELCVKSQIQWLRETVLQVAPAMKVRHNAYRMMKTEDIPPTWAEAARMIKAVMDVSPLGADAFPELSELMGLPCSGKGRGTT